MYNDPIQNVKTTHGVPRMEDNTVLLLIKPGKGQTQVGGRESNMPDLSNGLQVVPKTKDPPAVQTAQVATEILSKELIKVLRIKAGIVDQVRDQIVCFLKILFPPPPFVLQTPKAA